MASAGTQMLDGVHMIQLEKTSTLYDAPRSCQRSPTPPLSDDESYGDKPEFLSDCLRQDHEKLRNDIVLAPYSYIKSLPSKGIRELMIDALNVWFQVPEASLDIIKTVVDYLHTSSLMFDDIEDNSVLRRGRPATHVVFGTGQTMNSATYILMMAVNEAMKLSNPQTIQIVVDGVAEMLRGQSIDLSTTRLMRCPTEQEYFAMVDSKTGCLFQIATRLMSAETQETGISTHHTHLMNLFGRFFQIRDDYMNLMSDEYSSQKGFCEDLDEGKFSLPIIHCLNSRRGTTTTAPFTIDPHLELYNIFVTRNQSPTHSIPPELKIRILEILKESGSLEFVRLVLVEMAQAIVEELAHVEGLIGRDNVLLRKIIEKLKV